MPKLKLTTDRLRTANLLKSYSKNKFNQTRLAEQEGVSQAAISQRVNRPFVQKTLQEQIKRTAKKTGITLTWLLRKYKIGAEEAEKIIGYLHQYKKDQKGNLGKIKPDEIISNEFITAKDWATQRLYLRDIAEIMKWLKINGHNINIEQKNYVHIYRPEPYSREEVDSAQRPTNRSI